MHRVQMDEFGGPAVLHLVEVPDPRPGPGQVVVRTAAAGITFVETQVRSGRPPWPGPGPDLPAVLGNGVEGEIVSAGEGVDQAVVGRRVATATGGGGGYADHVVVGAGEPVPVPQGLADGEAVALLADGRTALALARTAGVSPVDRVLVTAAAGGVGTLLVQLARAAGARHVVAAAGGGRKLALARSLGADVVVDYTEPGWQDRVKEAIGGVDVAFDGVGGAIGGQLLALMQGGRFIGYGAASGAMTVTAGAAERGVTVVAGHTLVRSPADNRGLVEKALAEAAAGRLRPVIGQTFALSRAAEAHAAIEARATLGKTLLIPDA